MNVDYKYPGEELEIFEKANHWKMYFSRFIMPLFKGRILEVGAGIGGTTALLNNGTAREWVMLEPDAKMHSILSEKVREHSLPLNTRVIHSTINELPKDDLYDCIIYIDVLEHIESDRMEIENASARLKREGCIIILSPAFQFLFSPFDRSIGHYRRYDKKGLLSLKPRELINQRCHYLDSFGFFASLMNKWFLKQTIPTQKQILFWDRWIVPISKITDPVFFYSFGKSILAVWTKP